MKNTDVPGYGSWSSMRSRCKNPNYPHYEDYGGRGISVCTRWDSFRTFIADMGPRPDGTWIERRDNNGDYQPDNCFWATPSAQMKNKRRSKHNTTGTTGVYWHGMANKWMAQIAVNYKSIYLGVFPTIEEAAKARIRAEHEYGFNHIHGKYR